jgi:steroid 5-alpha reductase family enzyme
MLPTILFFQSDSTISATGKIISLVGVIIWITGLLIESFADQQKFKFKQNLLPENL